MRALPWLVSVAAAMVAASITLAQETEQRIFRARDGSTLKLNEESRIEYESWSSGHMCYLSGQLIGTPATRGTRQLVFVHDDDPACTGTLRFLDSTATAVTFHTHACNEALCGSRNPPPTTPIEFTAHQ